MLASPFLLGALAAGPAEPVWRLLPLAAFWVTGYLAFSAASLWLRSGRKSRYWPPVRMYAVLAAALGLLTLAVSPGLIRWVPAFVPPLTVGLWAAATRHDRDTLAGLATVLGSALMTLVAYEAGGGADLRQAALLAFGQFLYFGGTVLYVKSVIRERGNRRYLALSVGCHAVATLCALAVSPALALVFVLLTVRAAVVPQLHLRPVQIGVGEIASTLAVGLVSLAAI